MADTRPYQQIRFLKNYLLTILLWTINQRKEIMYVLVSFYFPQNINFINGEWNNVFIDKTFEGHKSMQCFTFTMLKWYYLQLIKSISKAVYVNCVLAIFFCHILPHTEYLVHCNITVKYQVQYTLCHFCHHSFSKLILPVCIN